MQMEKSFIIHLLHSIPHINVSLQFVNSTFNPNSDVYVEVSVEINPDNETSQNRAQAINTVILRKPKAVY